MTHLHLHDQRHRDQEHRQHVLDYDEHPAEHHLATAAEVAFDDVDGLVLRCGQGRQQSADNSQQEYGGHIYRYVSGAHHKGDAHARISRAHI